MTVILLIYLLNHKHVNRKCQKTISFDDNVILLTTNIPNFKLLLFDEKCNFSRRKLIVCAYKIFKVQNFLYICFASLPKHHQLILTPKCAFCTYNFFKQFKYLFRYGILMCELIFEKTDQWQPSSLYAQWMRHGNYVKFVFLFTGFVDRDTSKDR